MVNLIAFDACETKKIKIFRFFSPAITLLCLSGSTYAYSLVDLINLSITNHPSIQSQLSLIKSADAAIDSAKWSFFPTPGFSVQHIDPNSKDPQFSFGRNQDDTIFTFRLSQPLWTGGRLTALLDKAYANEEFTASSLRLTRKELSLRVLQFYSSLVSSKLRTQAIARSLADHEKLKGLIERRIRGGVSPEGDLTQVQMRIQQLRADAIAVETSMLAALETLNQLTGVKLSIEQATDQISDFIPIERNATDLLIDAFRNDPTLERLEAQIKLQQSDFAVSQSALQPDINLRFERQYGSFLNPDNFAGISGSNRLPPVSRVFIELGSNFGPGLSSLTNIESARLRYEATVADLESGKRSIAEQLQVAHSQYAPISHRIDTLQESLIAAKEIQAAWERQFLAGRRTWNDLMNMVREINQIDLQIADAQALRIQTSWQIAIVSQGVEAVLQNQALHNGQGGLK